MNQIKTVVLDIGNVLAYFSWREYLSSFGFPEDTEKRIIATVFDNPVWNEFDRGVWTDEEIIDSFCKADSGCAEEIVTIFSGDITGMVQEYDFAAAWVQELKSLGYQVLLLSNFGETLFQRMNFMFVPFVDGGIISYRVKCIKPDYKIYQILMEQYGLKPEEIVFVDDNEKNIQAAGELGWNTVHAVDHQTALKGLQSYGIPSHAGEIM